MARIFFDLEFTGLHQKTTPISIGMVSECEKTFYAEFTDYDRTQIDDWLNTNVIANLRFGASNHWEATRSNSNPAPNDLFDSFSLCVSGDRTAVKKGLSSWLAQFDSVEIWGDCLAYDWVVFCELFGHAFNIPSNVYYIPFDICTLFKDKGIDPDVNREQFALGPNLDVGSKHNALFDAKVIRLCHNKLVGESLPI